MDQWCEACAHPKRKKKCMATPEQLHSQWSIPSTSCIDHVYRAPTCLPTYKPEDFRKPQQILPPQAVRKGTQLARTAELDAERELQHTRLKDEISADTMKQVESLMLDMEQKISVHEAQVARLQQERHEMMQSKRQRVLSTWLQRPEETRPSMQLPTRTSHFELLADQSSGYSPTELHRTFRSHVQRVENFIESMVADPLKQLQLVDAVNRRFQGIKSTLARESEASRYVLESLRNFEATLRERFQGRYPNNIRAAHQAVCSAIMCNVPQRKVAVIAEATGFSYESLLDGRHRWRHWFDGTQKELVEFRGAIRSDRMKEEWIDFATSVWEQETRPSPSTKCSIRNPHNRSDKKMYRIHYLDMRMSDMLSLIVKLGKEKFADDEPPFHFSWWYCKKTRPFFVKAAGRETSVCIYHLRFDLLVEALFIFYKRLRDAKICQCAFENVKYPADFRRTLLCSRGESSRYDSNDCVIGDCVLCGELQHLNICGCVDLDSTDWLIRWEEYKSVEYRRKDGSIAEKKDFVVSNTTFQAFLDHFAQFWRRFCIHHQTAKLQDDDIRWVKENPIRGVVSDVEDFSENDHIQPKREHATRYFTEVGYTLYGMILTGHIDDFRNIADEHRAELKELFEKRAIPHSITESHIVISGDLTHDAAAVMHFNDRILTPYI